MNRRRTPRRRKPNNLRSLFIAAVALLIAGAFGAQHYSPLIEDALDSLLPGQQTEAGLSGSIRGIVARVADGDTFTIGTQRIRLCGIDAPERGQPGYDEAGEALQRLTSGRTVECRQVGNGTVCDGRSSATSYDRIVAQCFVGGRDIAAELVRQGHAIDLPQFSGGHYAR